MEKMKNMVVIKNIKSNLVEEAIVVFKENVKIKEKQVLRENSVDRKNEIFNKDYCINEAEKIVSDYIEKIENKKNEISVLVKLRALKAINIFLVLALLLVLIF